MEEIIVEFKAHHRQCESFEDVQKAIFDIGNASNVEFPILTVTYSDDISMFIGLADPLYWIHYMKVSSEDYFVPRTDSDSKDTIDFILDGQLTPMQVKQCVNVDTLLAVIKEFVEDGELPEVIAWERS